MSLFRFNHGLSMPRRYFGALALLVATTLIAAPLRAVLDLSNVALLYVLLVVFCGVRYGRAIAIFAALGGSLLFAYVFVPPHFSLAITDIQYLTAAGIMLIVALLVGHLTADLRGHVEIVEAQAARTKSLYEFARQLTATPSTDAVLEAGRHFLATTVEAEGIELIAPGSATGRHDPETARLLTACLETRRLVTRPAGDQQRLVAALPLATLAGEQGVLRFVAQASRLQRSEDCEFIETIGSLIAVALERTHFLEKARQTEVERAAENLRSTLLSSLSHDIRTPLTALAGTADTLLLSNGLSAERQRILLNGLREQAQSIHQLVTNLLDMARLQSGKVEPNLVWQPIEEVVGSALQQIRAVADQREFRLTIAPDLPPLRLDATLMERALWNLLENAVKYSPPQAAVDIDIAESGEEIEIAVCDRGPGLPGDEHETLFGLFARGQTESSIPGAGIGLAIVRSVAEIHQGRLQASPRDGGGTCFRLRLPIGQRPLIDFEDKDD